MFRTTITLHKLRLAAPEYIYSDIYGITDEEKQILPLLAINNFYIPLSIYNLLKEMIFFSYQLTAITYIVFYAPARYPSPHTCVNHSSSLWKRQLVFSHKWKRKPIITSALGLHCLSANAGPKDFLTGLHNTSSGFMTTKRMGIPRKCI